MTDAPFDIVQVREPIDLAAIIGLFRAYAASLDIDLAYQDFEGEMATMPGKYQPPAGELLLAKDASGKALGCVGLRPLDSSCGEMKRLYILPAGRGRGLGRALVEACIARARAIGYSEIRLDTLASMTEAQALYRKLGFEVIDPYYATPVAGTIFMRHRLERTGG